MSAGAVGGRAAVPSAAAVALLVGTLALFGLTSNLPTPIGAIAGAVGGLAVYGVRRDSVEGAGERAFVAGAVVLGALAVVSPSSLESGLTGGLAAVGLLALLADDPRRTPGGLGRSVPMLALVALVLGISWASAVLLPTGTALVGVGSALLVVSAIVVAVFLGRPDLIDREDPQTG